ncbi:MAG: TrbI/VirB10 family protein [Bdellovibrionales bacterium]
MTTNMDEFDQDQFDASEDFQSEGGESSHRETKESFFQTLKNKPVFKLVIIMGVVGLALALAMGVFTDPPQKPTSTIARAPALKEAPGGTATPFFIEQNKQANNERVTDALRQGGSALPTPAGNDVTELLNKNKKDPLQEFREETERLKRELRNEQQQNNQKIQMMQQKVAQSTQTQKTSGQDNALAQAMQHQMQQLMDSWAPHGMKVVSGYAKAEDDKAANNSSQASSFAMNGMMTSQSASVDAAAAQQEVDTVLVHSGTVNYAQLLMEANSDVPGPILAQILSGPLAGGRAIGRFDVQNDYLVITFNLVSLKGKEYTINALALDPDTTLGGMATEVDHRYFSRVVLPAAASFLSAFGDALSETDTTTTVADGAVLQDTASKGAEEALYDGLGEVGNTLSDFFRDEANKIQPLVRVAVGTPMGLFFLSPVMKSGQGTSTAATNTQGNSAQAANQGPYKKKNNAYESLGLNESQSEMLQNLMRLSSEQPTGTTAPTYSNRTK